MRTTVFDAPIPQTIMRGLAILLMRAFRWQIVGALPRADKFVAIAAPHTTNWDFIWTICIALRLRIKIFWMGKHTLFKGPAGPVMRWLGGIPINRTQANNTVEQSIAAFKSHDRLVLIIPPEGTRAKTRYWKTGFYHIAHGAGVPIAMAFLDFRLKMGGFGPTFIPTGDIASDMALIKGFYANASGKFPDQYSDARCAANPAMATKITSQKEASTTFFTPTGDMENDLRLLSDCYRRLTRPQNGPTDPAV